MAHSVDIASRDPERLAALAFLSIRGVGPAYCQRLREKFGSLAAAMAAGPSHYLEVIRGDAKRDHKAGAAPLERAARILEFCSANGVDLVFRGDAGWPARLDALGDGRPELLFVRGKIAGAERFAAVVGTRTPDTDGPIVTRQIAKALARANVVTVSGGAKGIDAAAHEGALNNGGRTWAVLGGGFAHLYPPENRELFDAIVAQGALITEFVPEQEIKQGNFKRRNLLVAAIAEAVVVVQGDVDSGAMSTAEHGVALKRPVLAVPGRVLATVSRGPHLLIRSGRAKICAHSSDVLFALGLIDQPGGLELETPAGYEMPAKPVAAQPLDASLEPVMKALGPSPRHLDDLAATVGWPAGQLLAALTQLELLGHCEQRPGKLFVHRSG